MGADLVGIVFSGGGGHFLWVSQSPREGPAWLQQERIEEDSHGLKPSPETSGRDGVFGRGCWPFVKRKEPKEPQT